MNSCSIHLNLHCVSGMNRCSTHLNLHLYKLFKSLCLIPFIKISRKLDATRGVSNSSSVEASCAVSIISLATLCNVCLGDCFNVVSFCLDI